MSSIPIDIIEAHILPKLPAKTLLIFKCVSKSWHFYISSHQFISLHLHHSLSSNSNHLLIVTTSKNSLFSLPMYSSHFPTKLPFPASLNPERGGKDGVGVCVVGCCDGLVCVSQSGRGVPIRVLNPCTGFYKDIASLRLPRRVCTVVYGFGYDSVSDDYKIVRLLDYYSGGLFLREVSRQVSVCSLKRVEWRVVEWTAPTDSIVAADTCLSAVLDKHLVHWMVWCYKARKTMIRCFDLRKESWVDDVFLPRGFENQDGVLQIGVFDGNLFVSVKTEQQLSDRVNVVVDIWIMKEYGVQESWIKLLSVSDARVTRSLRVRPVVYSDGRNTVLLSWENELCWYDLDNDSIQSAEFHGIRDCVSANDCIGSLVRVPGGHPFVLSDE